MKSVAEVVEPLPVAASGNASSSRGSSIRNYFIFKRQQSSKKKKQGKKKNVDEAVVSASTSNGSTKGGMVLCNRTVKQSTSKEAIAVDEGVAVVTSDDKLVQFP